MKRTLLALVFVIACAAPPPPETAPPQPASPAPEQAIGTGRVSATALNVRADASTDAEILTTVRRGTSLTLMEEREGWYRVRLASGTTGWVSSRYITRGDGRQPSTARRSRPGCPADSDFAFEKAPLPRFSEDGPGGLVVIEASVNTRGDVTSTRVVSNTTGDADLAALAVREIRDAKFIPPIRNCVPRAFIYTYRRTF